MTRLHRGFTLIEILVVVLVVSILMATVVASFSGADREQSFRGYIERLALRIEMARDKALQANREWGVSLDDEGVRFAEYDEVNQQWVVRADRPFTADEFDAAVRFDLEVEAFEALSDAVENAMDNGAEGDDVPDIVLFSSGEVTPFTITVTTTEWETHPWQLQSDGFTRTSYERVDTGL